MKNFLSILLLIVFSVPAFAASDSGERKTLQLSLGSCGKTHDDCCRFLRANPHYSSIAFKGEGGDIARFDEKRIIACR